MRAEGPPTERITALAPLSDECCPSDPSLTDTQTSSAGGGGRSPAVGHFKGGDISYGIDNDNHARQDG